MIFANIILFLIVLGLCGAQFGEKIWFLELFSHWVLQYLFVGIALLAYFTWKKKRVHRNVAWAVVIFCAYVMVNAVEQRAPTVKIPRPSAQIRFFEANLAGKTEVISNWLPLHAAEFDVLVFLETGPEFVAVMEKLKSEYPYQVSHLENSPFGIAILSRWEIVQTNEFKAEGGFYPQYEVLIKNPQEEQFLVYAMHLPPPFAPQLAEAHEVLLGELIEKLQQKRFPAVVLGDLNFTPYSKHYAKLTRLTGLRDSAGISPWQNTWPALTVNLFSPLGIRIDQCLLSTTFFLVERERLVDLKSDHLPGKCIVQIEK